MEVFRVFLPPYPGYGADVVGAFVKNGAPGVAVIPNNPGTGLPGNSLQIWTNNGAGALTLAHTYSLPQAGYVIATADLNGDGKLDLVVESAESTSQNWSYIVLLGNGDGSFQAPVLYQQSVQSTNLVYPIVIADFNNDHKLDLAFSQGAQTFALLLGNATALSPPQTTYSMEMAAQSSAATLTGTAILTSRRTASPVWPSCWERVTVHFRMRPLQLSRR